MNYLNLFKIATPSKISKAIEETKLAKNLYRTIEETKLPLVPVKTSFQHLGFIINGLPYSSKQAEIINNWRKAAQEGNIVEGLKWIDKWWKEKAPDNKINEIVYHGSKRKFNIFDDKFEYVRPDDGFFFTSDPAYAQQFGTIRPFYIRSKRPINNLIKKDGKLVEVPLYRDALLEQWMGHGANKNFDVIRGHDLITSEELIPSRGVEYVLPNNRAIKLSHPFTFDDSGNLIDITKRFNFKNPDVRDAPYVVPSRTISFEGIPVDVEVPINTSYIVNWKKQGGKLNYLDLFK